MAGFLSRYPRIRVLVVLAVQLAFLQAVIVPAYAQQPGVPEAPPERVYSMRELERLVAPIALYPDDLLTHVLMAATYPLDVVLAERWRSHNRSLKGRDLEEDLQDQLWDASVKALTAFPQVLTMMSEKLEWTQELGEAFIAQPDDVFAAVQALRARADASGTLKSVDKIKVRREVEGPQTIYIIEPYEPTVIYVPVYDPLVVYGVWPYPDYPPYYWYPRAWRPGPAFWFGSAIVTGAALWAYWDWRQRRVVVRPKLYNTFLKTRVANPTWRFDPAARKGISFKTPILQKKFGPIAPATKTQRRLLEQRLKTLPKSGLLPPTVGKRPAVKTPLSTSPITKTPVAKGLVPPIAPKRERRVPAKPRASKKSLSKPAPKLQRKSSGGVPQLKKSVPKRLSVPKASSSSRVPRAPSTSVRRSVPAPGGATVRKTAPKSQVLKKKN
ncbi:MAG: DUF3300 domain-containing protein [Hyphomicrobiaceae bacterium]